MKTGSPTPSRWTPFAVFLAAAALSAGLWWWFSPPEPGPQPSGAFPTSAGVTNDVMARLRAIEGEHRLRDRTVWSTELEARRFEDVLIDLWDALRGTTNALDRLAAFPLPDEARIVFGRPTPEPDADSTSGFMRQTLGGEPVQWTANEWTARLRQWIGEGWRLAASEWRMPRFDPGPPAVSGWVLTGHLENVRTARRLVLHGSVTITWSPAEPGPTPKRIDATGLSLAASDRAPRFNMVFAREFQPPDPARFIDPLLVRDIDGNGTPEILLVGANQRLDLTGPGRIEPGPIIPGHPPLIDAAVLADVTGDGYVDLVAADSEGILVFDGNAAGRFDKPPKRSPAGNGPWPNPYSLTAGDADADGDLDLWMAQYKVPYQAGQMPTPYHDARDGFPGALLINQGDGTFVDRTQEAGLDAKRLRRTYGASWLDWDEDGDADLVLVSDFAGLDVFVNNGDGTFTDRTADLGDTAGFGMGLAVGDFNRDGRFDVLMIGMNSPVADRLENLGLGPADAPALVAARSRMAHGNRLFLGDPRAVRAAPVTDALRATGWTWGGVAFDADNDGDEDLYLVNGHKSRPSARDYDRIFWTHDIFDAGSNHDPVWDAWFRKYAGEWYAAGNSYGGHEMNRLLYNASADALRFLEAGFLENAALTTDCRNVAAADLDDDGRLDLVVTAFVEWPRRAQLVMILRQDPQAPAGHWIGFQLPRGPGTPPAIGLRATLETSSGPPQRRIIVTGDSHRSQQPARLHFGLGASNPPERLILDWPDGSRQIVTDLEPDRYNRVPPPRNVSTE